jgi:ribosomal protein S18 acetylase RimI-like enzyme
VPDIRQATRADGPAIGRTLWAAFADDPVWLWMTGDEDRFARLGGRWFAADARLTMRAAENRVLVDADIGGSAIWNAPGHWKTSLAENLGLAIPTLRLFGRLTSRALVTISSLESVHPIEPHWYLSLLGTDPAQQGRGIGSALIRTVTDECDEQGTPAYLESSKESNVPYYERHGFKVTAELPLPKGGPSLWLMWRDPQ